MRDIMGVILGLLAAVCWGASDFIAQHSSRKIGSYRTLLFMQIVGFVGLSIFSLVTGAYKHLFYITQWQPWAWAFIEIFFNIVSSFALYKAFKVGVLAIVSPIAASYAALTVILDFLSGEVISRVHCMGMAITLLGIAFAATPKKILIGQVSLKSIHLFYNVPRGVGWAIVASICYGIAFWTLGFHVIPTFGGLNTVWLVRFTTISLLAPLALVISQDIRFPKNRLGLYLILMGILDTAAFIIYTLSVTLKSEQVSIINVLVSLFSVVTVLLAWIFLREKLSKTQWVGVFIIFCGIALVNL
ncbi:DMT family transporter [Dictyobacter aurantiacus]|uniref:EamA domain-containing protein n=1 Tax=Dictyobacter aurantiacus TaxID=1936993 RepID=A0A401ZRW5_9CHLR|nr:DMT family transporter [Dictyobacter aurantiacus]GCE09520.1 hypothetical protein KDAU_68490 [Dictyobacter aurantiacus]